MHSDVEFGEGKVPVAATAAHATTTRQKMMKLLFE